MNEKEKKKDESNDSSEDEITQILPEDQEEEIQEKAAAKDDLAEDPQAKLKEMEGKYLRTYADFENYKKRVAKEREEIAILTSEKLLRELLEIKDHLELALSHSKDSTHVKSLREGVDLTLKQLGKFLEKFGVKELQVLGEAFDPAFHEAIHEEEAADYKPGSVVHVYQKGYLFNGRLLRAARVTVAKEKK